jgi:Fe-S-cluster containining protein
MAKIDNPETENVNFVCRKCGECCRHIEAFLEIMPHQHDGICDFLQGNLCSRYETRPDLCDYKRAYKYFEKYLTEDEYRKKVIEVCEDLMTLKG